MSSKFHRDLRLNFSHPSSLTIPIKAQDTVFHARRDLLSRRSTFFSALLSSNWLETTSLAEGKPIDLKEVPADALRTLLHFLHTGDVRFPPVSPDDSSSSLDQFLKNFSEVLYYGEFFGVYDLKSLEEAASENIEYVLVCSDNVFEIWITAHNMEKETICKSIETYITKNFTTLSATNAFLLCPRELLRRVLSTGEIECENQFIMDAVELWGQFNVRMDGSNLDVKKYIVDLLPPQTMFSKEVKYHLLSYSPQLFY